MSLLIWKGIGSEGFGVDVLVVGMGVNVGKGVSVGFVDGVEVDAIVCFKGKISSKTK